MSDIAIRVENLSKQYRIGQREPYKALRDVLPQLITAPFRLLRRNLQSATLNPQSDEFIWALKDVSFEVKRGEVVGIPSTALRRSSGQGSGQASGATGRGRRKREGGEGRGERGKGKGKKGRWIPSSNLHSPLSIFTEPTEGCAEIHGRVGSLLEVGTGFHPELTGRENITLNGAILGMKRAETCPEFAEGLSASSTRLWPSPRSRSSWTRR